MIDNSVRENLPGSDRLDIIVRLHDSSRMAELKRAIFSLICQDYRPLTINLITQRFSDGEREQVLSELTTLLKLDPSVEFKVWNYPSSQPRDARSALLNLGIKHSSGRYLAILDYDDVIYNDGYAKLIKELLDSDCAIAFGKVVMKFIDVFEDTIICERVQDRFKGNNALDLFRDNFCPIHSFVIDRRKVDDHMLLFDENIDKLEDYNFLIKFCARYLSSFSLSNSVIGEYYAKNDGSNTIMLTSTAKAKAKDVVAWTHARDGIERLRRTCVVSEDVQAALGSPVRNPRLTVRQIMDLMRDAS
jgi:hypothetical protein